MRVLTMVLGFLLVAVPATAETIAQDDTGDHEVTAADAVPLTGARWNGLDLASLEVTEHLEGFEFVLAVEEIAPPGEDVILVDGIDWYVHFTYREADYRVNFYRVGTQPLASGYLYGANLNLYDAASDRWSIVELYPASVDTEAGTIGVVIPRDRIVGADGAGAMKDEPITDIHVVSTLFMEQVVLTNIMGQEVGYPVSGHDRMPNEGMVAITIQEGLQQAGTASLASASPVRVSNGEATTMVFSVTAANHADEQQLFALSAAGAPDHWTVTFPQERIRLDAGQELELPVLVTTPFNHEHGAFYSMLVEMQSQQDPSATGRIELGIRYTEVPQPAGHHSRSYIHIDGGGRPYFNTMEEDGGATGEEARMSSGCGCGDRTIYRYDIALLPGLGMGLDFDIDREGVLEVPVRFDIPTQDVQVYGEVAVYPEGRRMSNGFFEEGNEHAVATFSSQPLDFEADVAQTVSMAIQPTPYGDYLPFEPGAAMAIDLYVSVPAGLSICCIGPGEPFLLPGGWLDLPLNEYHDDVDGYFSSLTGVELFSRGGQEALVNPGKTVVFNATLDNIGTTGGKYALSLTGNNVEWARVLGAQTIAVPAGGSRDLAVAVAVPAGAKDGDQVDLALHAASVDDPNVRTLIRFLAEVDTDADHPDATDLALALEGSLADKKSPSAFLVLPVLAAAFMMRRAGRRD